MFLIYMAHRDRLKKNLGSTEMILKLGMVINPCSTRCSNSLLPINVQNICERLVS